MILFGGWDGENVFGDTWGYDPVANTWAELSPAGDTPAARAYSRLVFDPDFGKIILFGGEAGGTTFDDTWAYDPTTNSWTELDSRGDSPATRTGHSLVWDATSAGVVLFGGSSYGGAVFNDTWVYDPGANTWIEL